MKLVRKYAVGGITFTPYIPTPAGASTSSTSSTSSSSSSSSDKLTGIQKEIVDIVKENGIPSDVTRFLSQVQTTLGSAQNLSNFSTFGGSGDPYSMATLLEIQNAANMVKYNNERMTDAKKRMYEKDTGSELALMSNGKVYCIDNSTGALSALKPEELFSEEGKKQFTPIDNATLIQYRERYDDPLGLAYNTSTINDVTRSIGIDEVYKSIQETIQKFGEESEEHYTKKERAIKDGLETLIQDGPEGYYKITDTTQRNHMNEALTYLWNTLTPQAQHLVKARLASEGKNPNLQLNQGLFLLEPYMLHTKESQKITFDKTITDFAKELEDKKAGVVGADQLTPDTYLYRVASLQGTRKPIMIAPAASKISDTGLLVTEGVTNGAVVNQDMERLGDMSLEQFLQHAVTATAADASSITLGNRPLQEGEDKAIMFNSREECYSVKLPYDDSSGRMVPDLDVFAKFNELQRRIGNKKLPKTEIERIASEIGLRNDKYRYNPIDNSVSLTKTTWFLQYGAIVSDTAINLTNDNKRWLEQLDKDSANRYKTLYANMVKYGKMSRSRSDLKINDYNEGWFLDRAKFYKGFFYIPMEDCFRGLNFSMNQLNPKSEMQNFAKKVEMTKAEESSQQIGRFRDE
jgi:hypothetical protein